MNIVAIPSIIGQAKSLKKMNKIADNAPNSKLKTNPIEID